MKRNLITLLILATTANATEIVHKFGNPSFSGINQSAHYLTIDEQERTRKEKIRADADKQRTIILANATRDAEKTRGEGDAIATSTYAEAYNRDPEFYGFTRGLRAYRNTFNDEGDILLIDPDSDYFKYLNKSEPQ